VLKKAIRTAQNFFPGLGEFKNELYHWSRKGLGMVHDREFAAVAALPRSEDDLFLDVGANRGQSILALRRFRPDARIISFEPSPPMFRWLTAHFGAEPNVELVNFGLAPEPGARTLYVPRYRGFIYDGLATFSPQMARSYLTSETLYGFDPRRLTVEEHVCEARTLDSFGLAPSFIKIDVEGCEHEVLQGGIETLRLHQPTLMIERFYQNLHVERILRELGYREVVAEGGRFGPGVSNGLNMFWMTPRRLEAVGWRAPAQGAARSGHSASVR
jgi:FkbM family methyltransferase